MNKAGIILLSDLHLQWLETNYLEKTTRTIIEDVKALSNENGIKPEILLLAGDIVNSGEDAGRLYPIVKERLVDPIVKEFNIAPLCVLSIPGNHEIDRKSIDTVIHSGLDIMASSSGLDNIEYAQYNQLTDKLRGYFEFDKMLNNQNTEYIVATNLINISDMTIGVTRVNSVWSLWGDSNKDRKNIWIPQNKFKESLETIKKANIKICLMHHPIDWINDKSLYNIERNFDNFDIIINGHKHYDRDVMTNNTNCIQSKKLGPLSNDSGYVLLAIDKENSCLEKYYRKYNEKLEHYQPSLDEFDDACIITKIGLLSPKESRVLDYIRETKSKFNDSLIKLFINASTTDKYKDFHDFFIMPTLLDTNFGTVNEDPEILSADHYISMPDNLIIQGAQKSGKTVFAHYIIKLYYEKKWEFIKFPIYLDIRNKVINSNYELIDYIYDEAKKLISDDFLSRKSDIKEMLSDGNLLLVFDNYEDLNDIRKIYNFIQEYPLNRFIVIRTSKMGYFLNEQAVSIERSVDSIKFVYLEIQPLTKNDVRRLYKKIINVENETDVFFDKIIKDMDEIGLSRTPFNAALILFIYNNGVFDAPSNQTKVIEQYVETVLDKLNPKDTYYSTYDFNNKEDFLSFLSFEMYSSGTYHIDESTFENFVVNYHKKRGFLIEDSKFDVLFFDKMILINYNGIICFRFEFMFHYYLAKHALNDKALYDIIVNNYTSFEQEIIYLSGFSRNNKALLLSFVHLLKTESGKFSINSELFEVDELTKELFKTFDESSHLIDEQHALSEDEIDKITDIKHNNGYDPSKQIIKYDISDIQNFETLLRIVSNLVKNLDNIDDFQLKQDAMYEIVHSMMKLWSYTKDKFMLFTRSPQFISNIEASLEENDVKNEDEVLERINSLLRSFITLTIPIMIENEVYYQISSPKLNLVVKKVRDSYEDNSTEKLLMELLSVDMLVDDWSKTLNKYVSSVRKQDYLRVLFFKLTYLLYMRRIANGDEDIIKKLQKKIISKMSLIDNIKLN